MRNLFTCDICGSTVAEKDWDDRGQPFYLKCYRAAQNPLARLGYGSQWADVRFDDVCQTCHTKIAETMADLLENMSHNN